MQKLVLAVIYMCMFAVDPILWGILFFTVFKKKKEKKWYYIGSFLSIYLIFLTKQALIFMGNIGMSMCLMLALFVLTMAYSLFLFFGTVIKKITVLSVLFIGTFLIEYLAAFFCIEIMKFSVEEMSKFGIINLSVLIIIKIADMLFYICLLEVLKRKCCFVYRKELVFIAVLILGSIMPISLQFFIQLNSENKNDIYYMFLFFQILLEFVFLFSIALVLYIKRRREMKDKETIDFIKAQIALYANIADDLNLMKEMQQNMKSHLCSVLMLLKQKRNMEAEEYIAALLADVTAGEKELGLENTILAVVIYEQKLRAEKKKIDVKFNIEVQDIPLSSKDLNCIVSNMFANAITACENIVNQEKRKILFEIIDRNDKIQIICRNPIYVSIEGEDGFYINKMEQLNQNYGIRKINHMVEKNNGKFGIRFNQDELVMKAVFDSVLIFEGE